LVKGEMSIKMKEAIKFLNTLVVEGMRIEMKEAIKCSIL